MKNKNHKKIKKNPSYFCEFSNFQIKISPRPDRVMPEGYHHSIGNPLAVLFGQKNFRRGASPAKNLVPKFVDIHKISTIFKNFPAQENSKIRYGPRRDPSLPGLRCGPLPALAPLRPPCPSFFFCHNSPSVPSRLSRLVPDPYRPSMGGRIPTIRWKFGFPTPVRGDIGFL